MHVLLCSILLYGVILFRLQHSTKHKTKKLTCESLYTHLSTENKFNDSPEMFRTTGWRCCRPVMKSSGGEKEKKVVFFFRRKAITHCYLLQKKLSINFRFLTLKWLHYCVLGSEVCLGGYKYVTFFAVWPNQSTTVFVCFVSCLLEEMFILSCTIILHSDLKSILHRFWHPWW